MRGLYSGKSDKPITRRTSAATSTTLDDLGAKTGEIISEELMDGDMKRKDTDMSLSTGAKNAFSPSSVVEYARLPAKT